MPSPLPLLIAGAAAVAVLGGKKKAQPTKAQPTKVQSCSSDSVVPDGMRCRDGALIPNIIDESMLEKYEKSSGPDAGDFEVEEEDLPIGDNEEVAQLVYIDEPADPKARCEEFLRAVYVAIPEEGEPPINRIAVDMTVIPAMRSALLSAIEDDEPADVDTVGPIMVEAALAALVPTCEWSYDGLDFTFNNGLLVESSYGKDIIYSLMELCVQMVDAYNEDPTEVV